MKYKNGTDTKKLILKHAQKLFFNNGFKDTSIRQIADASHLSSGALYKHFDSKEAILEEIIDPHINQWWSLCNILLDNWKQTQQSVSKIEDLHLLFEPHSHADFYQFIKKDVLLWRFVFFNSQGTKYETFLDELINWETEITIDLLTKLSPEKKYHKIASDLEIKYIVTGFSKSMLMSLHPEFKGQDTAHYYHLVESLYSDFWQSIFRECLST